VNITTEPEMNAATVPKQGVGTSREELISLNETILYEIIFMVKRFRLTSVGERLG
jgi:hypothetical protein